MYKNTKIHIIHTHTHPHQGFSSGCSRTFYVMPLLGLIVCHCDGQDSVFYRPAAVRKIFLPLGSMYLSSLSDT